MRRRHYVVNRYRYISTLKKKFKAGASVRGGRALLLMLTNSDSF